MRTHTPASAEHQPAAARSTHGNRRPLAYRTNVERGRAKSARARTAFPKAESRKPKAREAGTHKSDGERDFSFSRSGEMGAPCGRPSLAHTLESGSCARQASRTPSEICGGGGGEGRETGEVSYVRVLRHQLLTKQKREYLLRKASAWSYPMSIQSETFAKVAWGGLAIVTAITSKKMHTDWRERGTKTLAIALVPGPRACRGAPRSRTQR